MGNHCIMECGGMERKNLPVQLKKNIYIVSLSSEIDVFVTMKYDIISLVLFRMTCCMGEIL